VKLHQSALCADKVVLNSALHWVVETGLHPSCLFTVQNKTNWGWKREEEFHCVWNGNICSDYCSNVLH